MTGKTEAVLLIAGLLGMAAWAGCGQYEVSKSRTRSAAPEAVGVVVDPGALAAPVGGPKSQAAAPQPQPGQESVVREKAEVGMGKKGHYKPGIITTPLATFWRMQEKVAFTIQIPHALDLYKAQNGHFPKTQEEFEREILAPNGIKLPELPAGCRYVYDPEKGELQVEHPADMQLPQ